MAKQTPTSDITATGGVPRAGTFGLIPVANAAAQDEQAARESSGADQPVIQGLAGHVRKCFEAAKQDKIDVEQRMLSNLRSRRGEYDSTTLQNIQATGGSTVFMMLTSAKCRAATAWLRDVFLGNGLEKPWSVSPTKLPDTPPEVMQSAIERAGEYVDMLQQALGGAQNVPESMVEDAIKLAHAREMMEIMDAARESMRHMEDKMEDQLQEGDFLRAMYDFLDDMSTFPSAILKGPVVRMKPQLTWSDSNEPVVKTSKLLEWERVSPFDIYPSPGATDVNDGYLVELHRLHPHDLEAMIGVDGYDEDGIREVIARYGTTGHREWTPITASRVSAEGRRTTTIADASSPLIDALQFWGPVLGKDLISFGMEKKKVPDETRTYHCEVWLVGHKVIKATLNYDPLGRRPYYKAAWEEIPGAFWGNSPADLIADCQTVCNAAARALTNNMAVASGPQVDVNIDRIPGGEDVTDIYPWKVWQTKSDPFGSNAPPVNFFQPQSNAAELMGIYEKFAALADEVSGIPKYLTGDSAAGGAGRTASGLSMMLQNAGKSIKSVVGTIDTRVMTPALERLFYYNMRYGDDAELKRTDVKIVARGAASLIVKEQAQVRRNEFLNICLSNPTVANIVGEEAIADLLRTMATGLDLDTDKIVPPPEAIRARVFAMRQQQLAAQLQAQQTQQLGEPAGQQPPGKQVMPPQQNRTLPEGGGQETNNFTPARQ